MKVREIMTGNVIYSGENDSLTDAAKKMRSADIGVLPVQRGDQTIGMITDRDIVVRGLSAELDPKKTPVKECMTREVFCCSADDDVESAESIMEDRQVHRLIVLGDNDRVVGILSLGDLALKTHDEHLAYRALERICEPAHAV